MAEEQIKVKQIKSTIGVKPKTKATMRALGLRKIGQVNLLPNRPEIQGMINKVSHLISIEKVSE
jgi:large subunit ribosomal protein L30